MIIFNSLGGVNPKTRKKHILHKQNILLFLLWEKQKKHQYRFSCRMPLGKMTGKKGSQLRVYPQHQNRDILLCGNSHTSIVGIFHHFNYACAKYKTMSVILKHEQMCTLALQLTEYPLVWTVQSLSLFQSTHGSSACVDYH